MVIDVRSLAERTESYIAGSIHVAATEWDAVAQALRQDAVDVDKSLHKVDQSQLDVDMTRLGAAACAALPLQVQPKARAALGHLSY